MGIHLAGFPCSVLEAISAHAEKAYPQECCGFLLGYEGRPCLRASVPGRNLNTLRAQDRFEIDPQEFLQAQMEAEGWGGEVLGFYHSHPDGAAVPSAYDRERAWPEYLYLIIPVAGGQAGKARLWQLDAPDEPFVEVIWDMVEEEGEDTCRS